MADGEKVVSETRRHYVVLFRPFAIWLLVLGLSAAVGLLAQEWIPRRIAEDIAGGGVVLASVFLTFKLLRWRAARYVFTDRRVLIIEGIIAKRVNAIPLQRISDSTYSRSVVGRMLGYGALEIDTSGGSGGLAMLVALPRPDDIYRLVSSLTHPRSSSLQDDDTGPLPKTVL